MSEFRPAIVRFFLFMTVLLITSANVSADISTSKKLAWSENAGWLNFQPTAVGMKAYSSYLSVSDHRGGAPTTGIFLLDISALFP